MLNEQIQTITSRETLASFIEALRANYLVSSVEWENASLESFLEALAAWVRDMDGFYLNQGLPIPEQPTWKVIAEMLLAARVYE